MKFIEKTELFMKRIRWKAHFFINLKSTENKQETYGFNTQKSPPVIDELKEFEESMARLIQSIEFEKKPNTFQAKLHQDINAIKNDSKLRIKADKTTNYYKMNPEKYNDLVNKNVTKTYKKSNKNEVEAMNRDAKRIAESASLKEHKPNFENSPACRLISPTKSEIGHMSKVILSKVVENIIAATGLNLWKSTREVLQWFQETPNKQASSFINFDIIDFYPSITEYLLLRAIDFAKQYAEIKESDIDIIIHAKRTLVFYSEEPWKKKDNNSGFDITMGSFDGAESCELIVCYLLSLLQPKYGNSVGLYRDDGLAVSTGTPREVKRMKKDICRIFRDNELRVTIEAKKVVNFLDVSLNLSSGQYSPYMKPNNTLKYINVNSNHPPTVLKNIPVGINTRLSELSSNEEIFNNSAPTYQKALDDSGFSYKLHYERPSQPKVSKRTRKRNIIWFNPPYDLDIYILDKCFPATNKLNKIFNRNTVKLSYSCMPNVKTTIEGNNKKILRNSKNTTETERKCSCPKNAECPLDGKCLSKDIVYRATVTSESGTRRRSELKQSETRLNLVNKSGPLKITTQITPLTGIFYAALHTIPTRRGGGGGAGVICV